MAERALTLPSPEQLVIDQTQVLESFFGHEALPKPPESLLEFIERTKELGFSFELYFEPKVTFTDDSNYPGLVVKPHPWLFEQIGKGNVEPDSASLSGQWAAMEGLQKPEYDDGKQLYENDPLAPVLEQLRIDGKIPVPDWCRHIPTISRFGISPEEIDKYVVPAFSELSGADKQITAGELVAGLSPWAAWFYRGNTIHPEWGQTNTWEWFANNFGTAHRLIGGRRDDGGLAGVHYRWRDRRRDGIGFRFRVASSS